MNLVGNETRRPDMNKDLTTATNELRLMLARMDDLIGDVEIAIGSDESHSASRAIDLLQDLRVSTDHERLLFSHLDSLNL
jgi:hypothetical protein